jgi:hypothetical protein
MTRLAEQVYTELLRYLYAASTSDWPDAVMMTTLVVLAAVFVLAAHRLWTASPRTPSPAAHRR